MLKRYDFTSDDTCHAGCRIEEFEDGEYVKYNDVKAVKKLGFGRVHCALCGADLSKGNHYESCPIIQPDEDVEGQPFGVLTYQTKTLDFPTRKVKFINGPLDGRIITLVNNNISKYAVPLPCSDGKGGFGKFEYALRQNEDGQWIGLPLIITQRKAN